MKKSEQPDIRWTIERDLLDWFVAFTSDLQLSVAVAIRLFLLQLKEGEPRAHALIHEFVELGLRAEALDPKIARVQLDPMLSEWFDGFVACYQHPAYPKRVVKRRHVLNGYVEYLRRNRDDCVRYGVIRLPAVAATTLLCGDDGVIQLPTATDTTHECRRGADLPVVSTRAEAG